MPEMTPERTQEVIMFALDALEALAARGLVQYTCTYITAENTKYAIKKLVKEGKQPSKEEIQAVTGDLIAHGYIKIRRVSSPKGLRPG